MDDRDDILSDLQPEWPRTLVKQQSYMLLQDARRGSKMATSSLALGILGVSFLPVICSLPAIILGFIARSRIKRLGGLDGEDGMALAGIILGFIPIILLALFLLFFYLAESGFLDVY